MISLTPTYVRLLIEKDRPFEEVTESFRSALQICRLNELPAAIVVSEQAALDWRSSLRVAIRFVATRWDVSKIKLALVAPGVDVGLRDDVCKVAGDMGFDCVVFDREEEAVEWVTG